jgi:ketosteroid isomerase-like protein
MAIAKKTSTIRLRSSEKAEIRQLIRDFFAALEAKNIDRMLTFYTAEAIMYDVKLPFQTKGAIAWRHTWEACIDYFPETFAVETTDMHIQANEHIAFAHYLFRFTTKVDHPAAQTWMRATSCYKKISGKWKIVHEHGSVPFNPHTLQAMFTKEL